MPPKEHLSNVGKKEQRQFSKLLDKSVKEGTLEGTPRDIESRTVPKQHKLRGKVKNK